jgi:hypothetical protein
MEVRSGGREAVAGVGESGEGKGEDEIVVLGGAGRLEGLAAGGRGDQAKVREFLDERGQERKVGGDVEAAGAEKSFEVSEEALAWDVAGFAFMDGGSGGDGDGQEVGGDGSVGCLDEVDDGEAGSGGVEHEGGADGGIARRARDGAGTGGLGKLLAKLIADRGKAGAGEELTDFFNDPGVGRAEREAAEEDEREAVFGDPGIGDRVAVGAVDEGAFEDRDGGVVALAADIESDKVMRVEQHGSHPHSGWPSGKRSSTSGSTTKWTSPGEKRASSEEVNSQRYS